MENKKSKLTAPQAPPGHAWQLEVKAAGDAQWVVAVESTREPLVTVPGLKPGTKYTFRSRVGEYLLVSVTSC